VACEVLYADGRCMRCCLFEVKHSAASSPRGTKHEGEEYLVRHPLSRAASSAPTGQVIESRCKQRSYRSGNRVALAKQRSYRSGYGVENLAGDRFDLATIGIDSEVGNLEVQRLAICREIIEYGTLIARLEQGPFAAATGAL